eukprot:gnl/MRDRNA2_/MRDRNA2_70892_c0_seq1.p1 gnl/MRDRNA2_/MRDRNA2_70892_c0~~gnl/MRDRNA2_/MRDRNA2_70892_c0_seq1.p1  ORF type:complete len:323 (-),score=70.66 gnl/MRDRNA2_/MRDRNA2_70892_c0_seq1:175-1143(-)
MAVRCRFEQLPSVGRWWSLRNVAVCGCNPSTAGACLSEARPCGKGMFVGSLEEEEVDAASISTFPGARKSTVRRRQLRKDKNELLAWWPVAQEIDASASKLSDMKATVTVGVQTGLAGSFTTTEKLERVKSQRDKARLKTIVTEGKLKGKLDELRRRIKSTRVGLERDFLDGVSSQSFLEDPGDVGMRSSEDSYASGEDNESEDDCCSDEAAEEEKHLDENENAAVGVSAAAGGWSDVVQFRAGEIHFEAVTKFMDVQEQVKVEAKRILHSGSMAEFDRLTALGSRAADALPDLHRNRATAAIYKWIAVMSKSIARSHSEQA